MGDVTSRDLRNRTRDLLERVAAGERITITADGHPVAVLEPVTRRVRWMPRSQFAARILAHQADPQLTHALTALAADSADEPPLR